MYNSCLTVVLLLAIFIYNLFLRANSYEKYFCLYPFTKQPFRFENAVVDQEFVDEVKKFLNTAKALQKVLMAILFVLIRDQINSLSTHDMEQKHNHFALTFK